MMLNENEIEIDLKEGQAVAFDFDGVIHKYSKGWHDGSIYDDCNNDMLNLMLILIKSNIPVFIMSTREPKQIKKWWDKQGFAIKSCIINDRKKFFNSLECIGITNKKLPAQMYIDDRGYKYTGQTIKEFFISLGTTKQTSVNYFTSEEIDFLLMTEEERVNTYKNVDEIWESCVSKLERQKEMLENEKQWNSK